VRALHLAPLREQAVQQCRRDRERRVGDDMERTARQPEVRRVGLDHHRESAEPLPEGLRTPRMQLDGDDPRAGVDQRCCERARARAHIDDQITAADSAVGDESFSPARVELMPSPPPWLSHGDGPLS
jgi:hypothetical protein